jgi:hypothetical protein
LLRRKRNLKGKLLNQTQIPKKEELKIYVKENIENPDNKDRDISIFRYEEIFE